MAKRKSSKRSKNMEPAEMTLFVPGQATVPTGGARTTFYIDLSQMASLVNRRFYRQGLNWAVAGIKIQSNLSSGSIEVAKLPTTWVMSNSYTKGFRAWQKMNNAALAETESVRPKFLDFKIFADSEHHSAGFAANLKPSAAAPSALSIYELGEWESGKVYVPEVYNSTQPAGTDTMNTLELIATGASYPGVSGASGFDAVSLIEGYAASRGLPNILDPNTPDDASDIAGGTPENWISAIFNEGITQDADVIDDLTTENNVAPYPFENGPNVTVGSGFPNPYADTMYPGLIVTGKHLH